jgi:hypothetical protein
MCSCMYIYYFQTCVLPPPIFKTKKNGYKYMCLHVYLFIEILGHGLWEIIYNLCLYACMYICIHACICKHTSAGIYIRIDVYVHTCVYVCMYVYLQIRKRLWQYIWCYRNFFRGHIRHWCLLRPVKLKQIYPPWPPNAFD